MFHFGDSFQLNRAKAVISQFQKSAEVDSGPTSNQWMPLDQILNYQHVNNQTPKLTREAPRTLPDLIRQLASGNIDLHQLQKMQRKYVNTFHVQ